MKRLVLLILVAAIFTTCQDGSSPTGTGFETPNFEILDGSTGGNVDFFFLPPLTSSPTGSDVGAVCLVGV